MKPNTLKNIALLIGTLVLSIVICDGLFRLYETTLLNAHLGISEHEVNLADLNYNDTTIPRQKPDDEYRILSFGDSFGYTITKYPYSYHGIAATLLNNIGLDKTIRIVNLGEPAISFYQYVQGYRYWASLIDHDAVIFTVYLGNDVLDVAYAYVANDIEINRIFGRAEMNMQTGQRRLTTIPHKYPLRMLDYGYAYYLMWKGDIAPTEDTDRGPYNRAVAELQADQYYSILLTQMDNFAADKLPDLQKGYHACIQFMRAVSEIRHNGKQVIIMLAPNEAQVTAEPKQKLVNRFQIQLNRYDLELSAYLLQQIVTRIDPHIPVLHLFEGFLCATRDGQDLYYGTDTHWSVEGNRLAGEYLARAVAKLWFKQNKAPSSPLHTCVQGQPILGRVPAANPARTQAFETYIAPLFASQGQDVAHTPPNLPGLSSLSPTVGSTTFAIGTINALTFDDLDATRTIQLDRDAEFLTITGWTIDEPAQKAAGGIYLVIDEETPYPGIYGLGRADVADYYHNPAYRYSGFEVNIPIADLEKGIHTFSPRILTHDSKAYYQPSITIMFEIL